MITTNKLINKCCDVLLHISDETGKQNNDYENSKTQETEKT